jgi:hypothetical protein
VGVAGEFPVGPNVEEPAAGVVASRSKGVAAREELHGVDVALVARESGDAGLGADVPQLGRGVAGAGDEEVLVGTDGDGHDVTIVVRKVLQGLRCLHVPQDARHVAGGSDDPRVVDEPAAGEVARVGSHLLCHLDRLLPRPQVVNRADIVKATARDKVARWGVRAGHHPRRPQGDRVLLVHGKPVPNDQLAVLRGGHNVLLVFGPMDRINLGKMALQNTTRPRGTEINTTQDNIEKNERVQKGRSEGRN